MEIEDEGPQRGTTFGLLRDKSHGVAVRNISHQRVMTMRDVDSAEGVAFDM